MDETQQATVQNTYKIEEQPFYLPIKDEVEIFERAWAEQIPLLLKGPTGCGKTRFVEYMAWALGQKIYHLKKNGPTLESDIRDYKSGVGALYTVACHEDLTAVI